MPMRIRRDDEVTVIAGRDKGRTGRVLRVDTARQRVYVEGVNIRKRHQRPRPGTTDPGGIIESEGPIHVSNVALLDPADNRPTRVGVQEQDGKRVRVSRRSGERI
jgi:large subunit ribosomal protein L24